MRTLLAAALLLAALASRAHAMGVYITVTLVAWNTDGTAALVTRDTSSSGAAGSSHEYLIVTADTDPVAFSFDDTTDEAGPASQKITAATCARTADDLAL